uniref:Uncharacterized protein n=1 Tax=Mycena chlorophos TaxID=658473 RepID=A0ABQ0LXM2_MYCCL|nr:predicted protein [Mycena chlorophos]
MTTPESLNLNSLASSLPSHSLNAHAEKALLDNFKAAALSITTLYRSSRTASKRAYNAGYAAACRDLMEMLQLGVSDSQVLVGKSADSGMTVGRVMDWVEARLEAVKAREEEEDEEEGVASAASSSAAPAPSARKPSPSPPPSHVVPVSPPRPSIPLKPTRHNKLVSSPPSTLAPTPTLQAPPCYYDDADAAQRVGYHDHTILVVQLAAAHVTDAGPAPPHSQYARTATAQSRTNDGHYDGCRGRRPRAEALCTPIALANDPFSSEGQPRAASTLLWEQPVLPCGNGAGRQQVLDFLAAWFCAYVVLNI